MHHHEWILCLTDEIAPIGSENAVRKFLCQMDIDRGSSLPLPYSNSKTKQARDAPGGRNLHRVPGDRDLPRPIEITVRNIGTDRTKFKEHARGQALAFRTEYLIEVLRWKSVRPVLSLHALNIRI